MYPPARAGLRLFHAVNRLTVSPLSCGRGGTMRSMEITPQTAVPSEHPAPDLTLVSGDEAPRLLRADDAERALRALYQPPLPGHGRSWVRASMVASIDGATSGADGTSASLNNPTDHRVFRVLRSWAQAVLVAAGTARTEGYADVDLDPAMRAIRRARGWHEDPALVLITARGELPLAALAAAAQVWTTPSGAQRTRALCEGLPAGSASPEVHVATAEDGQVDLLAVLAGLAADGFSQVLVEGGPSLLAQALRDGAIDELCLTQVPLLVGGSGPSIIPRALPSPTAARLSLLASAADGTLVQRWAVERA